MGESGCSRWKIAVANFIFYSKNIQNSRFQNRRSKKLQFWKLSKTADSEISAIFDRVLSATFFIGDFRATDRSTNIGYFWLNMCEYPSLRLGLRGSPNLNHLICGIGTPPETLQSRVTDPDRITSWSVLSFPFEFSKCPIRSLFENWPMRMDLLKMSLGCCQNSAGDKRKPKSSDNRFQLCW